jgi:hypothetical protein
MSFSAGSTKPAKWSTVPVLKCLKVTILNYVITHKNNAFVLIINGLQKVILSRSHEVTISDFDRVEILYI